MIGLPLMNMLSLPPTEQPKRICSSNQSSQTMDWGNIVVEQCQPAAGHGSCSSDDSHSIYLSLAARPVRLLQIQGDKTYTGLYAKGDISMTPEKMPLFARWDIADDYLQIQVRSSFIKTVSAALELNPDQVELRPEGKTRDLHIESIGMMLLTELRQKNASSRLYVDSLANILAVHLIRRYAAPASRFPLYKGGIPERQLSQVLEYIHAHLDQDIRLADLAQILDMSPFHFSRLFKRSLDISPYQYLLHQRIERAKELLKQSDRSIMEIALSCGFNSHSHLSKQFRQLTGMTPSVYREG